MDSKIRSQQDTRARSHTSNQYTKNWPGNFSASANFLIKIRKGLCGRCSYKVNHSIGNSLCVQYVSDKHSFLFVWVTLLFFFF